MNKETEIIKEQLNNISENLRKYVLGNSWSEAVNRISRQNNILEDGAVSLENEVLFVLICLEPPRDFVENIKRELALDESAARRIADSVNGAVFASVMKDIKTYWQNIPNEIPEEIPKEEPIKPYDSFEQTILRQAQAMRVAQAPSNLPGARPVEAPQQHPISNDPYREPVE